MHVFSLRLIELRKRNAEGELPSLSSEQIIGQVTLFIFTIITFVITILVIITLIIIGQAIIFIMAGFETTASTLSSLSYCLAKNPDVLEKLVDEVDRVVETSEGKIDQESIREMPYLEACIKETLRLLPPIFRTDRTCVKDWQEDGLFIPKGWFDSNLNDSNEIEPRNEYQHPCLCYPPRPLDLGRARNFPT